jgi:WD40 repeat protein
MHLLFNLRGHASPVTCLYHHKSTLISGDEAGNLVKWNLKTRRPQSYHKAHSKSILAISYCTSLDQTITQGRDNLAKIWDNDIQIHSFIINSLNFCKLKVVDDILVYVDFDQQVNILNLKELKPVKFRYKKRDDYGCILSVEFIKSQKSNKGIETEQSKNSSHHKDTVEHREIAVLCGFENGNVCLFTQTGEFTLKCSLEPILTISIQANNFICGGAEKVLIYGQIHDDYLEIEKKIEIGAGIADIAVKDFDDFVVVGCWDASIWVFHNKCAVEVLREHRMGINQLSIYQGLDQTSFWCSAGSNDGRISVWKL